MNNRTQIFDRSAALLADPALLASRSLIDGAWVEADDGATRAVVNPATGEYVAEVAWCGGLETSRAIVAARRAFEAWRSVTAKERGHLLKAWHSLIVQHTPDLATIMTLEQGKPLSEAVGELTTAAAFVEWYAEEAKRVYGDIVPSHRADARLFVQSQPIGVAAAITPWNFPSAMITRKVAPALAAGCAMVVKPAPQTPLSALALGVLAERAGLPKGLLNIVVGEAEPIGRALFDSEDVRKISFTGSTAVGKLIARESAATMKKLSLELGGNAPFIVFASADLDAAVDGAMASKFRNAGQTCVCANRLYVHADVYDDFCRRLVARVDELRPGNGLDPDSTQGPLIDIRAVEKVEAHVADASAKGARILTGGSRISGSQFFEPTVLADVSPEMRVCNEETFGPVAPVLRFVDEADVVGLANRTRYGLAGYFFSRDLAQIWRVADALEVGAVGVNTGMITTETAPFGGFKESGLGREGGKWGIEEFLETKYLCLAGL